MLGRGWATGSDVRSRGYTHIPDKDWNRIFGKKKQSTPSHNDTKIKSRTNEDTRNNGK